MFIGKLKFYFQEIFSSIAENDDLRNTET